MSLRNLLTPLLPPGTGWSDLARRLEVTRQSLHVWLDGGVVPARRVEALCDLLAAPDEVRAELKRRAGFQVLRAEEASGHASAVSSPETAGHSFTPSA